MNPEEMQQMSPDDAMAALAISTRMSEQMMAQNAPQQPMEGSVSPETAPEGTEMTEPTESLDTKIEGVKTEIKSELKDMIKEELEKLLEDEDEIEIEKENE